ncbi:MAG: MBL fold metallo-hydrolase [Halothiobacillaceae bacterium]
MICVVAGAALALTSVTAWAEEVDNPPDKYPESLLYDRPIEVADGVWSAIGATQPYTYENSGHNNNLSFVIGEEAVLVVNGSSTHKLAEALHEEIRQITDVPVKYVVNENAQLHAALGNSYWKEQGATIIGQVEAAKYLEKSGANYPFQAKDIFKDKAEGSDEVVGYDETFEDRMEIDLGGLTAELIYFGVSHGPGDISVFIPERDVLIAGDIAFHVRMLPVFEYTDTRAWLETWDDFAELAEDKLIIPGHGGPTDFATVDEYTRGYLEYLRGQVGKLIDEGGTLQDAYDIDQSMYEHLHTFDELARQNAGRVYQQMEFEF